MKKKTFGDADSPPAGQKLQHFMDAEFSGFLHNCLHIYNNNIYLLQLGCYPVAVVILHVNKTWNWLLLDLSLEGYMRSM